MYKLFIAALGLLLLAAPKPNLPDSRLAKKVRQKVWPRLEDQLAAKGLKPGSPIYIRIFKEEDDLEIWVKNRRQYALFKSFDICFFSGGLGTKTKEGDRKSPEGFYTIGPGQLNPASRYYLAINIGYPNRVERAKGCTGDAIMIHGHCASDGCYAMTNAGIEEIYTTVYQAFAGGQQKMRLDIYPFRMDSVHMKKYAVSSVIAFWKNLKPGYDWFERNHLPADVGLRNRAYAIVNITGRPKS